MMLGGLLVRLDFRFYINGYKICIKYCGYCRLRIFPFPLIADSGSVPMNITPRRGVPLRSRFDCYCKESET